LTITNGWFCQAMFAASLLQMVQIPDLDAPAPSPLKGADVPLMSFSTASVPASQRIDYWHSGVLRLLDTAPLLQDGMAFDARLTRLAGCHAELVEHAGSGQLAQRDTARCRADERDDISLNFMVVSASTHMVHGGTKLALRPGDIVINDSAVATELKRQKHRAISLFIPRALVGTICADPGRLAGRLLRSDGVAGLLRAHMRATMDHAAQLQPQQHNLAMEMAVQLALAALSEIGDMTVDARRLDQGFYHAARLYIAQSCTNMALNPLAIAAQLGCSRAALYRAFAAHGQRIAACIWSARLAHARRMLDARQYQHLLISEIAFRSGFSDHAVFDRMFKRAYGVPPGELRRMKTSPVGVIMREPGR
jgi:AraC-like DNA-binding protein